MKYVQLGNSEIKVSQLCVGCMSFGRPSEDFHQWTLNPKGRMEENFNVFDFTLTAEEMEAVEALDGGESLFFSHYDPEIVEWFMTMA